MSDDRPAIPDPYLPETGTPDFTVAHYDLQLEVKLAANRVAGRARLEGTVLHRTRRITLDLHGLSVSKVTATGAGRPVKVARSSARRGRLVVDLAVTLDAGADLVLDVTYAGVPSLRQGAWGEIGWEELADGVLVAGQPHGASTWFPCVDHPSVKSTYHLTVTTDAGYLPVCNGLPTGHRRRSSREEWSWELRDPAPSYLVTLQIGRYQLVAVPDDAPQGHPSPAHPAAEGTAPVFLAVSRALQDRAQEVLGVQTAMMACFSRAFGPYPFARYTAVVTDDALEIPLEAASLSIFGSNHLTGSWPAERLVAHELAHQWFGNALTLRRWRDIWLHEGFACYSEWLWGAESGRAALESYARTAWRGLAAQDQDLLVADPGPELMFDDRIYKRGALALFALRQELGAEAFGGLLRDWVAAHRHGTVDTGTFLAHADRHAEAAGLAAGHATRVLHPWLFETALPALPAARRAAVAPR
ncbi:M1 family peptidase [Citricoccus sp. SGAir0253]|uniref:M1 family metallopeptidase n=1 Tax=Citricoccus sp. SGAir0253 TaxID=2567881 RepID=UPI0010CD4632|nr:M1 family metallopeptidase [Citricoccus sp. SGAir0253]QCU77773.1 M1 family peptidase [Citricoccus sp. SGAir0253]